MPTTEIANRKGADTVDEHGEHLSFPKDVPVAVDADHAQTLLRIKDAGFYVPGEEEKPFDPNPGLSLIEEERRGKTRPSPFPEPEDPAEAAVLKESQEALDAAEANLEVGLAGPAIPPKHGRGSSAAAWQDYARQLGHDVDEGASREQIVAFLEARGIETEQRGGTATILGSSEDEEDESEQTVSVSTPTVESEVDPVVAETEVDPAGQEPA